MMMRTTASMSGQRPQTVAVAPTSPEPYDLASEVSTAETDETECAPSESIVAVVPDNVSAVRFSYFARQCWNFITEVV